MNSMNDERFLELAMKAMGRQATDAERTELEAMLTKQPELKTEFDRLQADARLVKEVLPLVSATGAAAGEFPGYARERLQTKVRQTLGEPQRAKSTSAWNWRWVLGLATGAALVVVLLVPQLKKPSEPVIQLAMLDTAGATRGSETNAVGLLKQQWSGASLQSFDQPSLLDAWEKNWENSGRVEAKVIYDRAAGELRVLVRSAGQPMEKTFVIKRDLAETLREAKVFVEQQTKR